MSGYKAEDFVLNPEFRQWVLTPNKSGDIQWERFLEEHPETREAIILARSIVLHLGNEPLNIEGLEENEKLAIWQNIKSSVASQTGKESSGGLVIPISSNAVLSKQRTKKQGTSLIYRYAAILIFALTLGLLWTGIEVEEIEEIAESIIWQKFETPLGVKSTVTLSDGSVVTLNSGTSISYRENFSGPKREIYMEGEAFFMVAPDSLKPFLVHAGGVSTMALGTSFNIKAFGNETTEISLVTGSVEVKQQNGENVARISPGEGVLFNPNADKWKRQKVDLDRITAWMNKTIVFDNTPFERAVHILENWYGVEIKLENYAGRDLTVTGRYQDESLKNILEGLGYGIGIRYRINGKSVIITFEQ